MNIKEGLEKYGLKDPWDIVQKFEEDVAKYTGAKYSCSLDNCTNAIFLCLKYLKAEGEIIIPSRTYLSVPQTIIHAGCTPKFVDFEWDGCYQLDPYPIVDSATRFTKGCYVQDTFQCLSFHIRKNLPLGKGGMILTNSKEAKEWFARASYEGRDRREPHDQIDGLPFLGYNFYMEPEKALKGLELFERLPEVVPDCGGSWKYKDLSKFDVWRLK